MDGSADVDDRAVQAHDEQAGAADHEHEQAALAAELWQRYHPGLTGVNVIASLQLTIWAEGETQGRTAEISSRPGDQFSLGGKSGLARSVRLLFALIEGRVVGSHGRLGQ